MCTRRRPSRVRWCARSVVWRRGATLIELLVVIALIGLLIGALLPSVSRSMQVAADTLCKHHLKELGRTIMMYQIENDGWLPTVGEPQAGIQSVRASTPWFAKLFPTYLVEPGILTCPEDPYRFRLLELGGDFDDPDSAHYSSYGINSFILTSSDGMLAKGDRLRPTRPLDTLLIADIGPDEVGRQVVARGSVDVESTIIGPTRNSSLLALDNSFDPFDPFATSSAWLTRRHGDKINVLTLEGGVRAAHTGGILERPVLRRYADCASGGCTLCTVLDAPHYSFAQDHLYWWTGPVPSE